MFAALGWAIGLFSGAVAALVIALALRGCVWLLSRVRGRYGR
jgi:hypothetical protein